MSKATLTEQVEHLIAQASARARAEGVRYRIKAIKGNLGWYYHAQQMTRPIGAWHRRPM